MHRAAALILALTASIGTAEAAGVPSYPPKDTCASLSGANAFRAALRLAVSRRSAPALVALASPQIRLDFGGGSGAAELRTRLSGKDGPALWRELEQILPLGCARQGQTLVMPSLFAEDLGGSDPFSTYLVTGRNVRLRAGGSASSRVVSSLSWNVVETVSAGGSGSAWRRVRVLPSGPTGYVAGAYLRSPVAHRLLIDRTGGKWRISAFVAGD
ncbi:SH3 domain-containing protein [Novosphingobium flavum]|uniref:SH3 domain-containing protein n=1 Tax=Novosphingobium flavum TaxID=1778672 RepID=A0A7X1FNV6_9SPHN|nr:SH3 domain-containing protein [Novosphingobium flavum]MBC2664279.1 SH3 domain-containing protein [Novosphingobium flavum]